METLINSILRQRDSPVYQIIIIESQASRNVTYSGLMTPSQNIQHFPFGSNMPIHL